MLGFERQGTLSSTSPSVSSSALALVSSYLCPGKRRCCVYKEFTYHCSKIICDIESKVVESSDQGWGVRDEMGWKSAPASWGQNWALAVLARVSAD